MHPAPFFELFAYISATCDAQRQIDSKQVHEYRKLRNSILSGYLPGGVCEATSQDVMMLARWAVLIMFKSNTTWIDDVFFVLGFSFV